MELLHSRQLKYRALSTIIGKHMHKSFNAFDGAFSPERKTYMLLLSPNDLKAFYARVKQTKCFPNAVIEVIDENDLKEPLGFSTQGTEIVRRTLVCHDEFIPGNVGPNVKGLSCKIIIGIGRFREDIEDSTTGPLILNTDSDMPKLLDTWVFNLLETYFANTGSLRQYLNRVENKKCSLAAFNDFIDHQTDGIMETLNQLRDQFKQSNAAEWYKEASGPIKRLRKQFNPEKTGIEATLFNQTMPADSSVTEAYAEFLLNLPSVEQTWDGFPDKENPPSAWNKFRTILNKTTLFKDNEKKTPSPSFRTVFMSYFVLIATLLKIVRTQKEFFNQCFKLRSTLKSIQISFYDYKRFDGVLDIFRRHIKEQEGIPNGAFKAVKENLERINNFIHKLEHFSENIQKERTRLNAMIKDLETIKKILDGQLLAFSNFTQERVPLESFVQRAEDDPPPLQRSKESEETDVNDDTVEAETLEKWLLFFKGNEVVFESVNRSFLDMGKTVESLVDL